MDKIDERLIAVAIVVGLLALYLAARVLRRALRNYRARLHAIRSIPLPRQTTLVSRKPPTQIEAVLYDVFDTELRRRVDGDPQYEGYSAEELAELRVLLFQDALRRRAPRILYEIEVGVPLLRRLEAGDSEVCAWVEERLKLYQPVFGKRDTIGDLILKPPHFRRFLWTHGIGASAVLFFNEVFRDLPLTIIPRGSRPLPPNAPRPGLPPPRIEAEVAPRKDGQRAELVPVEAAAVVAPAGSSEPPAALVARLEEELLSEIEVGEEASARKALERARRAAQEASPEPRPAVVREFLARLDRYVDRLDSFEEAFADATAKQLDAWPEWLHAGLADANGGANLAALGEEAVLDAFKRRARYRWLTSSGATAARPVAQPDDEAETETDEDVSPLEVTAEVVNDRSPIRRANTVTDPASEIGL